MKTKATTIIVCLLLAVTGTQAQKNQLETQFDILLAEESVNTTRSFSRGNEDGVWQCMRYDFTMPADKTTEGPIDRILPKQQYKKLIDNIIDAYIVESLTEGVSYSYMSEQPTTDNLKEHISFSIPYSDSETPIILGSSKTSSILVITKSQTQPKMSQIYAMEWEYVLQENKAVCKGSIYIIQTDKEIADVRQRIEEKRAVISEYQSELLRKLVFYRDKLKDEERMYKDKSSEIIGISLVAAAIAFGNNKVEIKQAIPIVLEMFAYISTDNNEIEDRKILVDTSELLKKKYIMP